MTNIETKQVKIPAYLELESAIGAALVLATKASPHKYLFAHDFDWLILPPIGRGQYKIFRDEKNYPLAFVSWAKLNQECEDRILLGMKKLRPSDWNSGEHTWIIDILGDPKHHANILHQLQEHQFQGEEVFIPQPSTDGKLTKSNLQDILKKYEENGHTFPTKDEQDDTN